MSYSNLHRLPAYKNAPRGAGLYIIGAVIDPAEAVALQAKHDAYLWNYPRNLTLEYVGISESKTSGVRGRLSCHARGKGNKGIAALIGQGKPLWFVTVMGRQFIEYESILLALQNATQFAQNQRGEFERSAKRQLREIRAAMTERDRDFYDQLDMGESGEGM